MVLTLSKVGNCAIFSLLPASIHFVPQRKYRYLVTPLLEPWNICHSFTLSISANHSIHFSYYYFERSAIRSLGIRKTRWFQFHLFLIWCSSFLSDPHHFFFLYEVLLLTCLARQIYWQQIPCVYLSDKVFISLSLLKDNFTDTELYVGEFFSLSTLDISSVFLLAQLNGLFLLSLLCCMLTGWSL